MLYTTKADEILSTVGQGTNVLVRLPVAATS